MSLLAPSILNADFAQIKDQIQKIEQGGADLIHCDVMDGHFVPNLTFGPLVVKSLKKITTLKLDVHLMVQESALMIDEYIDAGADFLVFHYEAVNHHHKYLEKIRSRNCKCGIALNPTTSLNVLDEIFPYVDLVLLMSVNPGFGGQKFIDTTLNKISKLAQIKENLKYHFLIEVDGGITKDNIIDCKNSGADIIVAGASIFKTENIIESTKELKKMIS